MPTRKDALPCFTMNDKKTKLTADDALDIALMIGGGILALAGIALLLIA